MTMPTMTTADAFKLPEPGYPVLTHVVSNALLPGMQAESVICPKCKTPLLVPSDKGVWVLEQPHPLIPELKIERMFLDHGGVEFYSMSSDKAVCARNFIPMDWVRITEEEMPIEMLMEEIAGTANPDAPMLTRLISNAFVEMETSSVACPHCKASVSAQVPSSEPIAWIVGQLHPRPLSGDASMRVMRILFGDGGVEIFSMSGDGKTGIRNFLPMSGIRLAEEVMPPAMFAREMTKAEAEGNETGEPDDPDDEPDEPEEPEIATTPANGQPVVTNPS